MLCGCKLRGKVTFDIKSQVFVLKLALPGLFDQMNIYDPGPRRAFYLIIRLVNCKIFGITRREYIEMYQHMLCSQFVLAQSISGSSNFSEGSLSRVKVCLRYWPIPRPITRCRLTKGTDFLFVTEYFSRARVGSDFVNGSVEMCDLTVSGEDSGIKVVDDTALPPG